MEITICTKNIRVNGIGGIGSGIRLVEMAIPSIDKEMDGNKTEDVVYIGIIEDFFPLFPENNEARLYYYAHESGHQIVTRINEIGQKLELMEDTSQDYSEEYTKLKQDNEELYVRLFDIAYAPLNKEVVKPFIKKYNDLEMIYSSGSFFKDSLIIKYDDN